MISYQPISATGLYHIVRHMILAAVNELSRDLASAIQNGNRVDIALIQISFCQHTVDFFADAPIFPINHVVDDFAIGQFDFDQVGQDIVGITGGLASLCFSLPLAILGMGVADFHAKVFARKNFSFTLLIISCVTDTRYGSLQQNLGKLGETSLISPYI